MSSDIAIGLKNLSKHYRLYAKPTDRLKQFLRPTRKYYSEHTALKNVSLDILKGQTIGIVGRNGSGKSTMLQLICGTLPPSQGRIEINGKISALLELGAGFNPEFTGRENIFLNGAILGMRQEEIEDKYAEIIAFSGLDPSVILRPVKTYSSGMYVRLAFAVAAAIEPDILVVDEALSVGDEAFQRKCFARIRALQERGGTILFVSHASRTILEICDRAILMDEGIILTDGNPKEVIHNYHKLIHAPRELRADIRKEIVKQSEGIVAPTEKASSRHSAHHHSAVFDPNLIPETTVSFESKGALIHNPKLTDSTGTPINLIERNQSFLYSFDVAFSESAQNIRFGMMIKTKSGVELGGASTSAPGRGIAAVREGDIYRITFRLRAMMTPGTYFLNCGCSGLLQGEQTFLHRVMDAAMFKVLSDIPGTERGIIDFGIEPEYHKIS